MSETKALLTFDPFRLAEQMQVVTDRTAILQQMGNHAWVAITESQASRFAEQGILVQFFGEADLISVPAALFDPLAAEPQVPDSLAAAPPTGNDSAYFIVQFSGPPEAEWLSQIEEAGGIYVQDNPVHTVIFRLTAALAGQVRALPTVRWVGLYHPAYALSFSLAGRQEPYSAVELRDLHIDPLQLTPTETGTLEIAFFDDVVRNEARTALEAAGATILADTGYSLVIHASEGQLLNLLRVPGLQAVERYYEAVIGNQRAGIIVGVNQVRDFNQTNFLINLDGTGEIAGVIDSGFDAGVPPAVPPVGGPAPVHPDLAGRITINNLYGAANAANTADTIPHGTHVAGTIAGNGAQTAAFGGPPPANPSTIRGMAPAAQVIMHAAHNPALGNNLDFRGFLAGLLAAHNAGARVHSNSWGRVGIPAANLVTNNTYDNAVSTVIDRFAFLHPESLVVFLAHNQEEDHDHDGVLDQNHLPRESVAKNILCVGACENETNLEGLNGTYDATFPGRFHFVAGSGAAPVAGNFPISDSANNLAMFSNRGRVFAPGTVTAQRRVRPDLVAPGTNIVSTGPQAMLPFAAGTPRRPNTAPPNFYYVDSGTSMATPVVAGAALLARQFYRQVFDQLRRPALLEQVGQLIDRPAVTSHATGSVQAWVHRDTVASENKIFAARLNTALARQGILMQLQNNVGDHPSPQLARSGDRTYLLHRGADNRLRLGCYDANLLLIPAFGSSGVVTLATASSLDDTRRPAMCIHGDEIAVVWNPNGSDNLVFQRFSATTGAAVDANPVTLGSVTSTSAYPYILHNGNRYGVVWVQLEGGTHKLLFRTVDNNGTPDGTQPVVIHQQAAAIREPHMTWNDLLVFQVFQIVWVDSRDRPDGALYSHMVTTSGGPFFTPTEIITVPPGNTIRRPFVASHPEIGNVLLWEDDTQPGDQNNFHFDVYLAFLGGTGLPDGRIPGNRLRISDTPLDTAGFACLVDPSGIQPVWQSPDEINSDLLGVYAARLTLSGTFQSQADPNTPLINSGRFVANLLNQHNDTDLTAVAMAWAGGDYFLLRAVPFAIGATLQLVHTNADGLPVAAFGAGGARDIDSDFGYENVALDWADTNLIAAHTFGPNVKVFLFDNNGNPVNTFGANGVRDLNENASLAISPGLGHRGTGNDFRIFLAYGRADAPTPMIRYIVLDRSGNPLFGPRDLRNADGTARHGWYHLVDTDHPSRSIAAWHRRDAASGNMAVFINRIELAGGLVNTNDIRLTTLAGDSQNAVIAPRPHVFEPLTSTAASLLNSRRREYGVAWQYRPAPASQWEIRFSCLDRNGNVSAPNDVQVVARAAGIADPALAAQANHATDPQLVWHTDGYGLAWLEQPPDGGPHTLFFTVIDINGNPLDLRLTGAAAAVPAAFHQVSADGADVLNYHLIWNGRAFRLTWVENLGGSLRHMQTALMIPRQQNQPNTYDQPYHHPTSALIRATLINGATNFRHTNLPNVGSDPNDGYGWGRLNLRQSLAPLPPVTFYVRDTDSVASGHTVQYHFTLPVDTRLLRLTLAWTDPPDVSLVNNLNLRLTAPDGRVFVGNRWGAAGTPAAEFSDPLPTPPPVNPFEGVHNVEQIVVPGNPTLPAGDYLVEVIGGRFRDNAFQQFPGQAYALVFAGSGQEVVYGGLGGGPIPVY
jgi:hypothetical protein